MKPDAVDKVISEGVTPKNSFPPTLQKPKPLKVILGSIAGVIVVAAITTGVLIYLNPKASKTASVQKASTAVKAAPVTPLANLTSATAIMTSGATSESTVTSTDDSSNATDASTSVGTVGSSIDENGF